MELIVDVTEGEVRQLEDIVEPYISYRVFGDGQVYKTRNLWVKQPTPS